MITCDLVLGGEVLRTRDFPEGEVPELHPDKGRWLPRHTLSDPVGPGQVREVGPVVVEEDRTLVTESAREMTEEEVSRLRDGIVSRVKAEAQRRILEIMPAHQQTNWLARKTELDILYGPTVSGWPAEDQDAVASVLPLWDEIKAIRRRSNEIEQSLSELSAAELVVLDVDTLWS